MTNLPENPLQNILKSAALTLPVSTGKVAVHQARIDRRLGEVVILSDISASMGSTAWGGQRKIDMLREAVAAVMKRSAVRLFVFSNNVREVTAVPEPEHNTNLARALLHVRTLDPGVTLVISDGQPDNAGAAIDAAKDFRGAIDVLYIGPENDSAAIAFMKRLAAAAGGEVRVYDLAKLGDSKVLIGHIAGILK